MTKKQNNNNFAKNTLLLAIGNILTKGLLFVMVPFFSRWLTTEDYGTFDLLCTYASLLIPIITLSTGDAMFRFSIEKSSDNNDKRKNITNSFFITSINLLLVIVLLLIIKILFNWNLAIPFIFLTIGEIYNSFLQSFLRALKKLNIYSFCSAISVVIISILVTIFVKYLNFGLSGIIYGYAIGYILGDLLISFYTKLYKYISIKCISYSGIKKLIKYSCFLIPNSISWWIVNVSDRFLIKNFLGAAANGIYAISNKIPAICTAIFSVFNISWQQEASEIVEKSKIEDVTEYFNKTYNNIYSILLSICIGILSCNYLFFNFIFDQKYFSAHLYSSILITSIIFMTLSQFYGGIQISLKMPKENGVTTLIGAILNVLINLFAIRYFGLYAAAFSTLISYIVVNILRKYKLRKILNFSLNKKNRIISILYLYYVMFSYVLNNNIFSTINLFLACLIFFVVNKNFILKILKKIMKI